MKQLSFLNLPPSKKEHGGVLAVGKRRSRRPLNPKLPLHITLRSDFAYGARALYKNHALVNKVIKKASRRFGITVYEKALCGNHLHLLIKGRRREEIQNFFRVVAGHIAQEILRNFPLTRAERSARGGAPARGARACAKLRKGGRSPGPCRKNRRQFWSLLLYSRVLSWGREYKLVKAYVIQNALETLGLVAYAQRKASFLNAQAQVRKKSKPLSKGSNTS